MYYVEMSNANFCSILMAHIADSTQKSHQAAAWYGSACIRNASASCVHSQYTAHKAMIGVAPPLRLSVCSSEHRLRKNKSWALNSRPTSIDEVGLNSAQGFARGARKPRACTHTGASGERPLHGKAQKPRTLWRRL